MVRTRSRPYGLCHCPYTNAYIKGFRTPYLHVYACLLQCFMLVLASLVLGFAMFGAFRGLDLVWLHLMLIRPCSGVTIWEASPDSRLFCAYPSIFHSAQCYACCACLCHSLAFYASLHAYLHVLVESCLLVCHPCFNTMKLWTFDSNLHLSLADTTFCCFLACLLTFLFLCLLCLSCLSTLCLFHMLFASFPSITCLLFSCLCLCMYTHGARTHGVRARSPRRKQKGWRLKYVDISQTAMFNSFRGLASPIWLCTLLKPLPSSSPSFLDSLY